MSSIEIAVRGSKRLESLLSEHYGAEGNGLNEKVSSVENILPDEIIGVTREIARIRNRVVHVDGFEITNLKNFEAMVALVETYLTSNQRLAPNEKKFERTKYIINGLIEASLTLIAIVVSFYLGIKLYYADTGLWYSILAGVLTMCFFPVLVLIGIEELSERLGQHFGEYSVKVYCLVSLLMSIAAGAIYGIYILIQWVSEL